jgi:hypothetical protein
MEKFMALRPYTEDDYTDGIPCVHKHRDMEAVVFPIYMSEKHPFDGGRQLSVKSSNGHIFTRTIGGSDLTSVFYAASKSER